MMSGNRGKAIMNKIGKISIVVSVYNEEPVLQHFHNAVMPILENCGCEYELIFVNDGSRDASAGIIDRMSMENENIKAVHFSKNYGHEAAMIAGIDYATGDGIICMDSDLQHPVELIPRIIDKFNEGYEVITMVRLSNKSTKLWKKATSGLFYKMLNKMSDVKFDNNASDFFAITKKPAEVVRKHFRESNRFLRAFIQSIGFKKTELEYEAKDRVAGESKYGFLKLFKFSISAILSFSNLPLRLASVCGGCSAIGCIIMIIYTIYSKIHNGTPSGYATTIVIICFMFMILFFLLGIIGEYLAIILAEIRKRPIYIVRDTRNIENKKDE